MIKCFKPKKVPKEMWNSKLNINNKITSKIITSDHINYMISDNNLTSFIVKEDIV